MTTKVTRTDREYARTLWEMAGPHAPSPEPGRAVIARMAVVVSSIRAKERQKTRRRTYGDVQRKRDER